MITGIRFAWLFLLSALAMAGVSSAAISNPQDKTEVLLKNKHLVVGFFQDVFAKKDAEAAARYLKADYIQHNPVVPTGLAGFQTFFREQFKKSPTDQKMEILQTVAEGDLVVIYLRFTGTRKNGTHFDITEFDMFRIEGDRIAEHWDAAP
jgi:predicted SnoaL-like aldol condensation-catalyzing enzyme